MKKLSTLALGLLAGLTMNVVLAQTPPSRSATAEQPSSHKPLTRADALAMAAKRFDAADANKDGVLTPEEMRAAHPARRGPPPNWRESLHRNTSPPPHDGAHGDVKGPPPADAR